MATNYSPKVLIIDQVQGMGDIEIVNMLFLDTITEYLRHQKYHKILTHTEVDSEYKE